MSNHIFVSYSRRDSNMLAKIASLLEKDGFEVWTDNNLVAGTPSWKNAIEQAIQDCFCVVILMSPGSKKSEWVERELDYAYILKKRIFPVLVDGSAQSAIPFELINIQYVDLRVDFDDQFDSLCDAIRLYQESNPLAYPKPENSNQDRKIDVTQQTNQEHENEGTASQASIRGAGNVLRLPRMLGRLPNFDSSDNIVDGLSDAYFTENSPHNTVTSRTRVRLLWWYLTAPHKLMRLQKITLTDVPSQVNAIFLGCIFSLTIFISNPLTVCLVPVFPMLIFSLAEKNASGGTISSFIQVIGKGLIIVFIISIIYMSLFGISGLVYPIF